MELKNNYFLELVVITFSLFILIMTAVMFFASNNVYDL